MHDGAPRDVPPRDHTGPRGGVGEDRPDRAHGGAGRGRTARGDHGEPAPGDVADPGRPEGGASHLPAEVRTLRRKLREWQHAPVPNGRYSWPDDLLDVIDVLLVTGCRISEALALRGRGPRRPPRDDYGGRRAPQGPGHGASGSPEVAGVHAGVHGGSAHGGHAAGPVGSVHGARDHGGDGVPIGDGDPAEPVELPGAVAHGGGDWFRLGPAAHLPQDGSDPPRRRRGPRGGVGVPGTLQRGRDCGSLPGAGARSGGPDIGPRWIL